MRDHGKCAGRNHCGHPSRLMIHHDSPAPPSVSPASGCCPSAAPTAEVQRGEGHSIASLSRMGLRLPLCELFETVRLTCPSLYPLALCFFLASGKACSLVIDSERLGAVGSSAPHSVPVRRSWPPSRSQPLRPVLDEKLTKLAPVSGDVEGAQLSSLPAAHRRDPRRERQPARRRDWHREAAVGR